MPLLKWLRGDPNKFQELPGDEEEEEEDGSGDERRGMNGPIESDGVPGFLHSNETLLISEEGEIKNTLNASREPTERPLGPPLPLQHRLPSQAGIPGLPRCARRLQPSVLF